MSDEQPEAVAAEPVAEKKAYDLKELGSKLKDAGLELAEDAAAKCVVAVLDWAAESAKISANPYDDVALIVIPKIKEYALSKVDKIDGKVGE